MKLVDKASQRSHIEYKLSPGIEKVFARVLKLYVELLLTILSAVNQIVLGTDWIASILPGTVTNQEARDAAWKKFLTSP